MAPAKTAVWLSRAYERYGEAVFAYAFHVTGERDEAERLSVAAFMDAHDVVADGHAIRHERVWLLQRVHERAPILPHDRRGGPMRRLPPTGGHELTLVRAELARLEPPGEDVLVLRRWCGLRPGEIAVVLDVPAADVRRALCEDDAATPRGRSRRRVASVVAAAAIGVTAAEMRAGVPKALASTVPGFSAGSASTAAGLGAMPLAAAAVKGLLVAGAAAAAIGAAHTVAPGVAAPWLGGGKHHSGSGSGSPGGKHGGNGKPGGKGGKGHPSKPSHPSKPAHPAHPTHPSKPAHPTHPTHPTHPSQPTRPSKPSKPTKPTRPTRPTHPSKPPKPTHPSPPAKPSKPAERSKP